jgi:leucyl-tRNA---protein transferase
VNDKISIDPFCDFRVEWSTTPGQMDEFWATGWRHFGPLFFRRYFMEYEGNLKAIQPLRVQVREFRPSKSQRRILRRNGDLKVVIKPTVLDQELSRIFMAHVQRFTFNVPPNLESFLGHQPEKGPCQNMTVAAYVQDRLIAASFLDLGQQAVSSVYAVFDPVESRRSLGIFTMLREIEYARERGCHYYYPGYACHEPSPYDYKKQLAAMEWYDWEGHWKPLPTKVLPVRERP